jgi:hypothetical protein
MVIWEVMSVLGDRIVKANELLAMKKASEMPAASSNARPTLKHTWR